MSVARVFAISTLCAFALLFMYGVLLTPPVLDLLFHTDVLHPQALLDDVFLQGGHLADWTLPPNPSLFPDGILYFLGWSLSPTFRWALVWYAFQILLLSVLALYWLLIELRVSRNVSRLIFLTALLGAPLLWEISPFHPHRAHYASVLLLPISHGSVVLLAVLTWCLTLRALEDRRLLWRIGLALLLIVSASSDRLVSSVIGVPLLIVLALEWNRGSKNAGAIALLSGASLCFGELLLRATARIIPLGAVPEARGATWGDTIGVAVFELMNDLSANPHLALSVMAIIGWIVARSAETQANEDRTIHLTRWYFAGCFIFTLVIPIVTGVYRAGAMRYIVPGLVLGLIGMLLPVQKSLRAPSAVLGSIMFFLIGGSLTEQGIGSYFWYRPRAVRCLDTLAVRLPTRVGVSDYWNSKRYSYLSETGLFLLPLERTGELATFAANKTWYETHRPAVSFAIVDRLSLRALRERFGRSEELSRCGGSVVRVFHVASP